MENIVISDIHEISRAWKHLLETKGSDEYNVVGFVTGRPDPPKMADNLNCKACEHFSGLVKMPYLHEYKKLREDLERLSLFIDDIGVIRILGGEPLLNPELDKIMEVTREIYPLSEIWLVTNGLILDKMSEQFFEVCNRNKIFLLISYYPPLVKKKEAVEKLLQGYGVHYGISKLYTTFRKRYLLEPHDEPEKTFDNCLQAHCVNLYDGKLAACFLPFTQKYFNDYWGYDIPCDGAIDLYDSETTTEKLMKLLHTPFERCRYCRDGEVSVNWGVADNKTDDWVI